MDGPVSRFQASPRGGKTETGERHHPVKKVMTRLHPFKGLCLVPNMRRRGKKKGAIGDAASLLVR